MITNLQIRPTISDQEIETFSAIQREYRAAKERIERFKVDPWIHRGESVQTGIQRYGEVNPVAIVVNDFD